MTIVDSLLVGIFGLTVVFVVLVGLSMLLRLQAALTARFTQKKEPEVPVPVTVTETTEAVIACQAPAPDDVIAPGSGKESAVVYSGTGSKYIIAINKSVFDVEVCRSEAFVPPANGGAAAVAPTPTAAPAPAAPRAAAPAPSAPRVSPPPADTAGQSNGKAESITSPVGGTVTDIKVAAGTQVKRGQCVLLLEAMKMENEIVASMDGTVTQVLVSKGETVACSAPLIIIQ